MKYVILVLMVAATLSTSAWAGETVAQQLAKIKADQDGIVANLKYLQSSVNTTNANVTKLQGDVSDVVNSVNGTNANVARLKSDVDDIKDKLQALQGDAKAIKDMLAARGATTTVRTGWDGNPITTITGAPLPMMAPVNVNVGYGAGAMAGRRRHLFPLFGGGLFPRLRGAMRGPSYSSGAMTGVAAAGSS